jgi:hypothetical protein
LKTGGEESPHSADEMAQPTLAWGHEGEKIQRPWWRIDMSNSSEEEGCQKREIL